MSGAPFHPATVFRNFQVKVAPDGKDLQIAAGRFYVDGILCENEAEPATFLTQPDLPGPRCRRPPVRMPCTWTSGSGM